MIWDKDFMELINNGHDTLVITKTKDDSLKMPIVYDINTPIVDNLPNPTDPWKGEDSHSKHMC